MHSASATQRHERAHESSLQCTTNRKPRFRCNAKSGNVPRRPVPRAVPRKLVVQVELTGFEPRMLATQPGPSSPRSNCVKGEVTSGHGCLFATSNVVINETHAGPLAPVPHCQRQNEPTTRRAKPKRRRSRLQKSGVLKSRTVPRGSAHRE